MPCIGIKSTQNRHLFVRAVIHVILKNEFGHGSVLAQEHRVVHGKNCRSKNKVPGSEVVIGNTGVIGEIIRGIKQRAKFLVKEEITNVVLPRIGEPVY